MTVTVLTLTFNGERIEVVPAGQRSFHLNIDDGCLDRWQAWVQSYRALPRDRVRTRGGAPSDTAPSPASLGHDLFSWLNEARDGWLSRWLPDVLSLELRLVVPARGRHGRRKRLELFHDLPWEVLAEEAEQMLAQDRQFEFAVLRYLGTPTEPAPAPKQRLGIVYMAAAPEDQHPLHFEAEESAILQAVGATPLDFFCDESGYLAGLAETLTGVQPAAQVLHLSCHGEPGRLCFEDAEGKGVTELVTASQLRDAVTAGLPPLLFLSSCASGDAVDAAGDPHGGDATAAATFSRALVGLDGVTAVVAWAGKVADAAATEFAAFFYRSLAAGDSVARAVMRARSQMVRGQRFPHDWHRARVWLAPSGGGVLVGGIDSRLVVAPPDKEYLDKRTNAVPVAGRHLFVGRRREIRRVLGFVRDRKPGVVVYGVGGIGKSSFANRIALRLPHHRTLVLHGRWDATLLANTLSPAYKNTTDWAAGFRDDFETVRD